MSYKIMLTAVAVIISVNAMAQLGKKTVMRLSVHFLCVKELHSACSTMIQKKCSP